MMMLMIMRRRRRRRRRSDIHRWDEMMLKMKMMSARRPKVRTDLVE
jgi:hypothetical protein